MVVEAAGAAAVVVLIFVIEDNIKINPRQVDGVWSEFIRLKRDAIGSNHV
jgi:hypothetical protein